MTSQNFQYIEGGGGDLYVNPRVGGSGVLSKIGGRGFVGDGNGRDEGAGGVGGISSGHGGGEETG